MSDVPSKSAATLPSGGDAAQAEPRWPCLTIVYHPVLRRIGERSLLGRMAAGATVTVARTTPAFSVDGDSNGAPIDDPHISRDAMALRYDKGDVVVIRTGKRSVIVDGLRVEGEHAVKAAQLDAGAVIELSRRVVLLLHRVALSDEPASMGLIGGSDAIRHVRRAIARVADLDVPVLIRGETGAGKERVAQAIHAASKRSEGPLVAVNMAAISPSTASSELFGHARGAFTGAVRTHDGVFARASGGTLFLDEVGETPAEVQAMLLRTLETATITPVGGSDEQAVDVRVIAATDADLEAGADDGSFRAALRHRLSGYEVWVPPLRDRRDDIARLAIHFLREQLRDLGELDRLDAAGEEPWFPPALMARLVRFDWPGNVRQLRNVIRQLTISNRGAESLRVDPSVERILDAPAESGAPRPAVAAPERPAEVGEDELVAAMRANRWVLGPTARALGIPRSTLYDLIDRTDRVRKAKDLTRDELVAARDECRGDLELMAETLCVSKRGIMLRMKQLEIGE